MAEAMKKKNTRKLLSEDRKRKRESNQAKKKMQSRTGFYSLARADSCKRMQVRYRAGLLSVGLVSNNLLGVLLCLVLRLLDVWLC